MKPIVRICLVFVLVSGIAYSGESQSELQAIKLFPPIKPVCGQILNLLVQGLRLNPLQLELPSSLRVTVTQAGRRLDARLHRASPTIVSEPSSGILQGQAIHFTLPSGLVPGTALVEFSLGNRHSNQLEFEIGEKPAPPAIAAGRLVSVPMRSGLPQMAPPAGTRVPGLVLEVTRGQEASFAINPMIDEEEAPDAAVLLAFRQGSLVLHVTARIVHYPARREGNSYFPSRDEVAARAPEELSPGEADIILQVRLNGLVSDPVPLKCTVR